MSGADARSRIAAMRRATSTAETDATYAALRATNPVAAARYAEAHGLHGAPATPPTTADPAPPDDPVRATYRALRASNPVVAARFAEANGLHDEETR